MDNKKTRHLTVFLDIRQGLKKVTTDTAAGIDFKALENLSLPDRSSKTCREIRLLNRAFMATGVPTYTEPAILPKMADKTVCD